ncbi:hypothetical protein B0H19DRAFT_1276587 [Mycena capillaripes]|nr:hypothetical protein B0H19DRAFT_1276587 [Mycena capillaripes]
MSIADSHYGYVPHEYVAVLFIALFGLSKSALILTPIYFHLTFVSSAYWASMFFGVMTLRVRVKTARSPPGPRLILYLHHPVYVFPTTVFVHGYVAAVASTNKL